MPDGATPNHTDTRTTVSLAGIVLAHLIGVAVVSLSGCSLSPLSAESNTEVRDPVFVEPAFNRTQLPELSVSLIETGYSMVSEGLVVSGGNWGVRRRLSYTAALVRHPEADVLIDTGLGTKAVEQFNGNNWLVRMLFGFTQKVPAVTQFERSPVAPKIENIILTHMHWDHVSGLKDFGGATFHVYETEYQYAMDAGRPEVIKEQFDGEELAWNRFRFSDRPYENFSVSFDLFGDGSIVLVPLPGHTPGSVGVFVNSRSGGRYFFSGDLTWVLEGIFWESERPWPVRGMVDSDRVRIVDGIRKVRELMTRYPELTVLPAHDGQQQEALPAYPDFLR